MTSAAKPPPLYGLVLVGGASSRMGRPKWALSYTGRPQAEVVAARLAARCERVFLSASGAEDGLPDLPLIPDSHNFRSPTAGILSAMEAHPEAAWLVVACDLPFLDDATLDDLVASRAPERIATAYRSAHGGLPEPLCAIWEPHAREALLAAAQAGRPCPRKVLINADPALLALANSRALDNVNTPEEHRAAVEALAEGWQKQVEVLYFGQLRDAAGVSSETVLTSAGSPRDLYLQLGISVSHPLAGNWLRVAVNDEFASWDGQLEDGDLVAFLPPMAGG